MIRKLTVVIGCFLSPPCLPAQAPDSPAGARLVVDDLRHFNVALRALHTAHTVAESIAVLEEQYFKRSTPGFRAYAARYNVRPDSLALMIARYPRYYASLADMPERIAALEPRIRSSFEALERLYPGAVFPPTYFFVADFKAGGVVRPEGLLLSVEVFGRRDSARTSEAADVARSVQPTAHLPFIVAHELVHFQQATVQGVEAYRAIFGARQSLLALAIREGSADFIGALISGGNTNWRAKEYGLANEAELWTAFSREMLWREPGDWMFVRPRRAAWPQDLGYFMGYRITEAYFKSHSGGAAALQAILGVTDYEAFLRESGYRP